MFIARIQSWLAIRSTLFYLNRNVKHGTRQINRILPNTRYCIHWEKVPLCKQYRNKVSCFEFLCQLPVEWLMKRAGIDIPWLYWTMQRQQKKTLGRLGGFSEIHCRANLVTFTQPLEKEEFIISWLASKSLLLIASSSKLAIYWKCHLSWPMQILLVKIIALKTVLLLVLYCN